MQLSGNAFALLRRFEGCRLAAYQDVRGIWTIGYGHTRDIGPGMTCTQGQADEWLEQDARWVEQVLNSAVRVPLTQNQFDALGVFVYNVGSGSFERSTLLALVNEQKFTEALLEFPKWAHAGGAIVPGLLLRRQAEAALFARA